MSQAGYNPSLNTDSDRVRFLTGDTKTPDAILDDEEIEWLLSEEPNVYYAAAAAIGQIARRCSGTEEARLAGDTFKWNGTPESIQKEIERMRERGAEALMPKPHAFRVL